MRLLLLFFALPMLLATVQTGPAIKSESVDQFNAATADRRKTQCRADGPDIIACETGLWSKVARVRTGARSLRSLQILSRVTSFTPRLFGFMALIRATGPR